VADAEVIVVGAGPAGSSTAWHLARAGVDVLLLDRAGFPRDKVCAEYLSPQASRILAGMGALERLEHAGVAQLAGMRVRAPNGREIVGRFAARHHGFRGFRDRGLAVRRTVLDATLLDRAREAGARVHERVHVTDILRDDTGRVRGVVASNADGERHALETPLVIGADGLRSVIGRRLGLTHVARAPRRMAFVAHYRGIAAIGDMGEMHVERDGYVGIADIGDGICNVALVLPARAVGALPRDTDALHDTWIAEHPHLAERFRDATRLDSVRATGPFATAARPAWAPGAALVGDAAEFFDPFTGEGVYKALRGGELLAPFAQRAARADTVRGADAALREYESERRAEFGGKWLVEKLIGGTVAVPALINHAARALTRRPEMADLLVGVAGDFIPAREVLRAGYFARLLLFGV
jgi:geranylgeranyl reductase family protein